MKLIFLGAPGVGKGTQGIQIAKDLNIPQISTGDILRASLRDGTPLGKQAKSYMEKGELVPDDLIINMMRDRLNDADCKTGFLLDGFPRSIPQAEALDELLIGLNKPLDAVVNIDVDQDAIVSRLTSRRICRSCGADYNVISNPPPENMQCIKCDGEIYQRDDDKEETILNRLKVYNNETSPLIDYYRNKSILKTVDGNKKPDVVNVEIKEILKV